MALYVLQKFTRELAKENLNLNSRFLINHGQSRKPIVPIWVMPQSGNLYRVIRDDEVTAQGYLRVIDESGEEYTYAASRFHLIQLSTAVEETLLSASQA